MNNKPPRPTRPNGQIGVRALILGLLLTPINSLWIIHMEKVQRGPYPTTISLFANAIFILTILLLLNAIVGRIRWQWGFTQAELLVVYTMVAIGSALAGHDGIPILIQMMPHVYWLATKENRWMEMFGDYIPQWAVVSDLRILKGYFEGNSNFHQPELLAAWLPPVLVWTGFIFALGVVMMCLSILARNLWVERERLTYPIVELPLQMTAEGGGLWRNKLFWMGFVIAFTIDLLNGLNILYPNVPVINVRHMDYASFPTKPWSAIDWLPFSFYPFAIGLGFLLPVDLLFSCWFFYLFFKFQMVFANAAGMDTPGMPFVREQGYGAYLAIAVILFWNGRGYLREVVKRALGKPSEIDDSNEGLSYRTCFILIAVCSVFLIGFLVALGLPLPLAVISIFLYFVFSLVITRIRAELGPPVHDQHFSGPDAMITQAVGTQNLSHQTLTAINWLGFFNRAYRAHPMPILAEGLKVAHTTGSSNRKFTRYMMAAILFGTLSAFWAFLWSAYHFGAEAKMSYGTGMGAEQWERLANWINSPTKPNFAANQAIGVGFLTALGLGVVRNSIFNFPFHPIGYAISGSWAMNLVWMPLFIAWIFKSLILHYGGLQKYKFFLPFFLGLIVGQCIVGCGWTLAGLIFGFPNYAFWGS